jgi:hypothetical protein
LETKTAFEIREFQEARRVRRNSPLKKVQMGAVISKRGKIRSSACNMLGSVTFHAKGYPAITLPKHAEVMAIMHAQPNDIKGSTMWVWREINGGTPAISRPCERSCLGFLRLVGIARIVYTTSEYPYFREELL